MRRNSGVPENSGRSGRIEPGRRIDEHDRSAVKPEVHGSTGQQPPCPTERAGQASIGSGYDSAGWALPETRCIHSATVAELSGGPTLPNPKFAGMTGYGDFADSLAEMDSHGWRNATRNTTEEQSSGVDQNWNFPLHRSRANRKAVWRHRIGKDPDPRRVRLGERRGSRETGADS